MEATIEEDRGSRLGRRSILLVEDNPGDADLARWRLRESPSSFVDIHLASTLAGALSHLSTARADAILLDLNLPDSSGLETLQRLKAFADGIPIAVLTGVVDDALRRKALDAGAEDVFAKDEAASWHFPRSILYMIERLITSEQHRQLQRLLDAAPDAILVVNHSGKVRYVNQAAVDLFSRARADLLSEPLGFSVQDLSPTEIVISRTDDERICEMRVVQLEWEREPAYLATVRDVTERKRLDELRARSLELELENRRIQQVSRVKSDFVSHMSHELRTPLNAIIGFSELLYDRVVEPESPKFQQFLSHILSSGAHLLQLVNDILDLGKIEAGEIDFHPEEVDLAATVTEVVDVQSLMAQERRITVSLELDDTLTKVHLDAMRFKQVLYNYLSNALKFTREGGAVVVRTRVESDVMFRLEVEDNGIGIPPRDIEKLFVEFQQLDTGLGKQYRGTGLGLALTKRLVQAQGGSVGVESIPGKGSLFFASLPRFATGDTHP